MLLELDSLTVRFGEPEENRVAVDSVDLRVERGEWLALVGESGCGKSVTASALVGLAPEAATVSASSFRFDGKPYDLGDEGSIRALRGVDIGMVFQDPLAALDPVESIGAQLVETIRAHADVSRQDARAQAIRWLEQAGLDDPARLFDRVPHQVSGGQRQRVTLALALAPSPKLLIADEATTALDPTLRLGLVQHLDSLRTARGLAILFVTHDLGLVAHVADRIAVMYAGRIVEVGPRDEVLASPKHPYTRGLVASIPELGSTKHRLPTIPGVVPPLGALPKGCAFGPRCDRVGDDCRADKPPVRAIDRTAIACLHPIEGAS